MLRVILLIASDSPALTAEAATLASGYFRDATQTPVEGGIEVAGFGSEPSIENFGDAVAAAWGPTVTVTVLKAVHAASEAPVAPVEVVPVEVAPVEVATTEPDTTLEEDEDAFVLRLTGLPQAALVDEGLAVCRELAGKVEFAEPPTGWEGDAWCIRGRLAVPDAISNALKSCNATVSVSRA